MIRPAFLGHAVLCFYLFVAAIAAHSEETATLGKFFYDPLTGASTEIEELQLPEPIATVDTLSSKQSFTIEVFADPDEGLMLGGGQAMPVIRAEGEQGSLWAGVSRGPTYHWWSVEMRTTPAASPIAIEKRLYRGLSMVTTETPWRHVAVVWNSETKSISFFIDYQLQAAKQIDPSAEWKFDRVSFGEDGGTRMSRPFAGRLTQARLTPTALEPWHFLRASGVELRDVSFAPEQEPALPADYGHIDVRLHYGAIGDGVHDDTAAIQRAFLENCNRVPIEYKTVYLPAGTYLISDSIRFDRFMVVRGAGQGKTIIQLVDNSPGYDNPEAPKPVFAVGYDWPYVNRPRNMQAGNAIGSYIFDLTIDTGRNNPAALGLDYHSNNHGAVENVTIRSSDRAGLVGLDLKRAWPGPCLMKNVTVDGFDVGIDAAHREYSLVFSGIELRNQNQVAIRNRGNTLSIENLTSTNRVPVIQNSGGGLTVLINSALSGGAVEQTAITSENASLYLRNVIVDGYGKAYVETRTPKDGPVETLSSSDARTVSEYFTGPHDSAFPTKSTGSLKLEIKETPVIPRPPLSEWVNVVDYEDLVHDGDWSSAIQAAIDSGKQVVYFPEGRQYQIGSNVIVRQNVHTFFGGSPKLAISNGWRHDKQDEELNPGPAILLAPNVERFQVDMLHLDRLIHETAATVVFRHGRALQIDSSKACGDIFVENAEGKWRLNKHQRVWARQLNPETKGIPEVINQGGQLWILGMKTEYLSTKIAAYGGAKTELLGGLMYPVHPVNDESLPMFINENSDISLVHSVSVYSKNHKVYIRDSQGGQTVDLTDWRWVSGRPLMNLYRSESR